MSVFKAPVKPNNVFSKKTMRIASVILLTILVSACSGKKKTDVAIWLAKLFDKESRESIANQKTPQDRSRRCVSSMNDCEFQKQYEAFE